MMHSSSSRRRTRVHRKTPEICRRAKGPRERKARKSGSGEFGSSSPHTIAVARLVRSTLGLDTSGSSSTESPLPNPF